MSYEIEIQKNIPIPEANTKRMKYPFLIMEVGDSFWAPKQASHLMAMSARIKNKEFRSQKEGDGTRIWRIA